MSQTVSSDEDHLVNLYMSVTDIFELGRQAMFAEEFDITR
jgi:hypothetical protein